MKSSLFSAATVAALLACAVVMVALPLERAAAADKPIRREVGLPLKDAQDLAKAGKFREALAKVQEADEVKDKTSLESYDIALVRQSIYSASKDYPNLVKAAEALIASGQLPPEQVQKEYLAVVQIEYQQHDLPKAIEYTNQYYKAGGTDPTLRGYMAQAYYQQGDYANAAKIERQVVQAESRGGKPTEEHLKLLMSSDYKIDPAGAAYVQDLQQLVLDYPNKDYWSDLVLVTQKKAGFADRFRLDIYLFKLTVGSLDTVGGFMEATQLALEAGLPGDAKTFMAKGYASGLLGVGTDADRQKRLSTMANTQADKDSASLPQLAKDADKAKTGKNLIALADAYASYGQYDQAIPAYLAGIAKGGLEHPDDAKLHLGVAYLMSGQKAKAKETLKSVTAPDGAQDIATLWLIQSGLY
jgi:hypothetical protein